MKLNTKINFNIEKLLKELNINPTQLYKTLTVTLCVSVFLLCALIVLSVPLPLGSDPYFHLNISKFYFEGNFQDAFNYITSVNMMPFYPPLYHTVMLAPVVLSGAYYDGLRILEMFTMPLTFTFTLYLLYKYASPKAALITGLTLLGSWSFIDGALQARPQALSMMLYPLTIIALYACQKKRFILYSALSIYNHGVYAVSILLGPTLYRLKQKSWRKTVLAALIVSAPILALTGYYFGNGLEMWATLQPVENPQETLFWTNPAWIPFYSGLTLIGVMFLFAKSKSELETIFKYGFVANLIMLPIWADRWLQYSAIPLACLVGLNISRWHGKKLYVALSVIALGAWIYISFFLLNSVTANWWQPGRSMLPGS